MKRIDDYINSVYKNFESNNKEIEDLKLDMRSHLIEVIDELKKEGHSEEKSIDIALERFGDKLLLEGELTQVIKEKRNKTLFLLSLLYFPITYILAYFIGFTESNGRVLRVVLVPIYSVYEIFWLNDRYKRKIPINKSYELIKFCFIIYLIILCGNILFPLNLYPDLSNSRIPTFDLIPFYDFEVIPYKGFELIILKFRVIAISYLIPLGILVPIISSKFRSVKRILLLACLLFILRSLITTITGYIGLNYFPYISIDTLINYLSGTLIGYGIYSLLQKQAKFKALVSY